MHVNNCLVAFRMEPYIFRSLASYLRSEKLIKDTRIKVEEKLTFLLYMLSHNASYEDLHLEFEHNGWTFHECNWTSPLADALLFYTKWKISHVLRESGHTKSSKMPITVRSFWILLLRKKRLLSCGFVVKWLSCLEVSFLVWFLHTNIQLANFCIQIFSRQNRHKLLLKLVSFRIWARGVGPMNTNIQCAASLCCVAHFTYVSSCWL